ncbi:MAG: chemotaxis protein CheW [Prochloraceae cyanobacterium]|nr:chemotaxis protein CheW [Prochloraceae cyanobacterium]
MTSQKDISLSLQNRCILTRCGKQELAFPSKIVAEIIVVNRKQLLPLSMYDSLILGVVHHQGSIIPLISLEFAREIETTIQMESKLMKETLIAVRLNEQAGNIAGVGIVVEGIIGSVSVEAISVSNSKYRIFAPQDIPERVWQPNSACF